MISVSFCTRSVQYTSKCQLFLVPVYNIQSILPELSSKQIPLLWFFLEKVRIGEEKEERT